jgi:hypothetical protein
MTSRTHRLPRSSSSPVSVRVHEVDADVLGVGQGAARAAAPVGSHGVGRRRHRRGRQIHRWRPCGDGDADEGDGVRLEAWWKREECQAIQEPASPLISNEWHQATTIPLP